MALAHCFSDNTHLEEHDRLLPVCGFAPGRGVQTADGAAPPLLLLPLRAAAAAADAELDGEVDADAVDVAGVFRLKSRSKTRNQASS